MVGGVAVVGVRQSVLSQTALYFPSLSFVLVFGVAVFLLPDGEFLPPVAPKTVASDVVWTRRTVDGEVVRLSAVEMRREPDGTIESDEVRLEMRSPSVLLTGEKGVIENTYRDILLTGARGEMALEGGGRLTVSLASARLRLDGSLLTGEEVAVSAAQGRFRGDSLRWDKKKVVIRGNVRAVYRAS